MKTISFVKKHLILGTALMVGAVAMSFNSSSKKDEPVKESKSTTYYYNSTDTSANAFAVVGHWSTSNDSMCETGGQRPCRIVVQEGQSLSSILAGKNNSQVLAVAQGRKP